MNEGHLIYWMLQQFAANNTALVTMLVGMMATAYAWRLLGYERHIRRVAEIEHRIAVRNGRTLRP